MPNIGNIINMHNRKILTKKKEKEEIRPCNCKKFICPLKNSKLSCRTESVVYEATITTRQETKKYIGLTAKEFKERFYQHRHDFNTSTKIESTKLSKYIWGLKKTNTSFEVQWKILKKVAKINNGNRMCRLCITEAILIMKGKKGLINKRNEIMNKCRRQNKFLLQNWKKNKRKPDI